MKSIKSIYIQIIIKVLGLLFFSSGLTKIVDSESFIELLFKYKLGILSFLGPLISPIEIIIGLCFLLGLFTRKATMFTFILTAVFTLIYSNAYFRFGIKDCGCFGEYFSISSLCEGSCLRTCVFRSLTDVIHKVIYHSFISIILFCFVKSIIGTEATQTSIIPSFLT